MVENTTYLFMIHVKSSKLWIWDYVPIFFVFIFYFYFFVFFFLFFLKLFSRFLFLSLLFILFLFFSTFFFLCKIFFFLILGFFFLTKKQKKISRNYNHIPTKLTPTYRIILYSLKAKILLNKRNKNYTRMSTYTYYKNHKRENNPKRRDPNSHTSIIILD